jgi:hypothetical protein
LVGEEGEDLVVLFHSLRWHSQRNRAREGVVRLWPGGQKRRGKKEKPHLLKLGVEYLEA